MSKTLILLRFFLEALFSWDSIKKKNLSTSSVYSIEGIPIHLHWNFDNAIFVKLKGCPKLFLPSDTVTFLPTAHKNQILIKVFGLFQKKEYNLSIPTKSKDSKIPSLHKFSTQDLIEYKKHLFSLQPTPLNIAKKSLSSRSDRITFRTSFIEIIRS